MFELAAAGVGQTRIAKQLNSERALAPQSQRQRPRGWVMSSVHAALNNPTYRGEIAYKRTRKRDQWGRKIRVDLPETGLDSRPGRAPSDRVGGTLAGRPQPHC
jgi:hypothetical protein